MPELPEVETVRRGLAPVVEKKTILRVDLYRAGLRTPFPASLGECLTGAMVDKIERRAKYLLFHCHQAKNKWVLALHLGMSGRVTLVPEPASYQRERHDHVMFFLDNGYAVVLNDPRRFGMVILMKEESWTNHPAFHLLGPEPLSAQFSGRSLYQALKARRLPIKQALMDQHCVAGVGNIYASEALFEAGIDPLRPACTLDDEACAKIVKALKAVLKKAIAAGGSSLRDHRQADGSLGYFQHKFRVYGREGQACPRCKKGDRLSSRITKIIQGGRATFFCPVCQK